MLNIQSLILVHNLSSSDSSCSPGGDETNLLTGAGTSLDSGGLTDMLVITSSMGMLNRVHGNTTSLGPTVPLGLVFVVGTASLQHGLVNTTASGYNTNHGSVGGGDNFFVARGQLDPGPLGVSIVSDDCGIISTGPGKLATVTGLLLKVADNGSLRHLANRHHIANGDVSLLATVDKLSSVHAFSSNKELLLCFVSVWITEVSNSKGSTTARVMNNVFDDSLNVTVSLREVHSSQCRLALPVLGVRHEDGPCALSLGTNNTTHFSCRSESSNISLV